VKIQGTALPPFLVTGIGLMWLSHVQR
jgi:hypothetical protein